MKIIKKINKQGTSVAGSVRSEPGDGGGREDDDKDKANKAAEDRAPVTGHAENKIGLSAASGDGGEADEEDKTEEAGKTFCRRRRPVYT